jgi:hypothetical protein
MDLENMDLLDLENMDLVDLENMKTKKIKRERGSERKTTSTLVKDQENMKVGGGLTTVEVQTEGREAVRG